MPSRRSEDYGFRLARTYTSQLRPTSVATPPKTTKPAAVVKPAKSSNKSASTDTCTGLHNGRFVRVPIQGVPLPAVAMVLEAGEGQMTVRITEGVLAGAKQIRPCADARP